MKTERCWCSPGDCDCQNEGKMRDYTYTEILYKCEDCQGEDEPCELRIIITDADQTKKPSYCPYSQCAAEWTRCGENES